MQPPVAPLIGIIADHKRITSSNGSGSARTFVGVYATYLRCLTAAGALPVVIPLEIAPGQLRGIFDRLDGILLTGGGDIDPTEYGETPINDTVREIIPERDTAELAVTRWAAEADMPLLGICRGHQVVNVALGGNLIMDIPAQLTDPLAHSAPDDAPLSHPAHPVAITPGTRLASILHSTEVITNSRHHQSVLQPAPGLAVTAHSPDGVIEALEMPAARFFLSVQWHPENLCDGGTTTDMTPLFRAFVDAAAAYQQDKLSQTIR